jgi:DNA-binding MarR family transcriptional regulator
MLLRYLVLNYIKQHPGEEITISSLAQNLKITRSQARNQVDSLEYTNLICHKRKYLPDSRGVLHKTLVYFVKVKSRK